MVRGMSITVFVAVKRSEIYIRKTGPVVLVGRSGSRHPPIGCGVLPKCGTNNVGSTNPQ